jgi:hypothetical protein
MPEGRGRRAKMNGEDPLMDAQGAKSAKHCDHAKKMKG